MASLNYNSFAYEIAQGNVNLGAVTFKAVLVTAAYVPNKETHSRRDDVTNEVASGNGYTTGGNTATLVVTQDNANDRIQVTITVASWPASSITARGVVIYKARGGVVSADELCFYLHAAGTQPDPAPARHGPCPCARLPIHVRPCSGQLGCVLKPSKKKYRPDFQHLT